MKKNGEVKLGETHCTCGGIAVAVKDGVPLCEDCAEEYDDGRTAAGEPSD